MSERALGWDTHRKFSKVSVIEITEPGEFRVVERARLDHEDQQGMRRWLSRFAEGTPVALEAAFGWPWVADLLQELKLDPHLAHPPATRVLARHEAKTDRCDADRLGRFYLQGKLPESYLAPPEVRDLRDRIRYRMALSRIRTGIKNRIGAVLHRRGVLHRYSDLFGRAGRQFLAELNLPPGARVALQGYLEVLDQTQRQIDQVEQWMQRNLKEDEITRLLETIPGIGVILTHVLKAEIGDLRRFPTYRHLASYAGLAPVANESADRHGRRHTSPACNRTLRWALVEAASVLVGPAKRQAPRLQRLYSRLTGGGRGNKSQAKVALAREVVKLVYVVWSKRQPYQEDPPARPGSRHGQPTIQADSSKRSMRSDQPRHPMVRRRPRAVGQTLK